MDAATARPGRNVNAEGRSRKQERNVIMRNRFPLAGQGGVGTIKDGRTGGVIAIFGPFPVPRGNPGQGRAPLRMTIFLTVDILCSRIPHGALFRTSTQSSDAMERIQPDEH